MMARMNSFDKLIDRIFTICMANLAGFDLNLLRVLDALLRERSTVRAGERLGLSQPAVSAALGRLRHALGDPLFVRQGQGMTPSSLALALEPELRRVLQDLETLLRGPGGFDPAQATFDFRISGTDFFSSMLMPALVQRLAARAPGVRVQLVDLVPDAYVEMLDRYEVDLGLIPERDFPAWVAHARLLTCGFVVVARRGHPRLASVPAAAPVPLPLYCALDHVLCSPEGRLHGLGDAALAAAGHRRRVVASVPVFEGVLRIVAQTDLLALVPVPIARMRATEGTYDIYAPPVPISPVHLCMIWHRRFDDDPGHRWMRGQVAEVLAPLGRVG